MPNMPITVQQIHEQIGSVPAESLSDLADYIEFLRFRVNRVATQPEPSFPLRIVRLRGLLKEYDFSPELLTEARGDMWRKLHSIQ